MTGAIFTPDQLRRLVTETLPLDAPAHAHVVVGTVDQHGAQIVASFKREPLGTDFGCQWEVQAAAHYDWASGETRAEARVLLQW